MKPLQSQQEQEFDDFQHSWRNQLEKLIFANLNVSQEQKRTILEERFSSKSRNSKKDPSPRWKTSLVLDRQTYGSFIRHFAERFLKNPQKHPADGEIVLLLWVMIYIAQDPDHTFSIKRLLELTTADVEDQIIRIDGHEIDISVRPRQSLEGVYRRRKVGASAKTISKFEPRQTRRLFSPRFLSVIAPWKPTSAPGGLSYISTCI